MSDSIAKILWEASEGASRWGVSYDGTRPDLRESAERGARAVALHVLGIACPGSTILAAMRQGMSFEEAVERDRRNREAMSRAADRIDEPTEAEFAASVGKIFAGIAAVNLSPGETRARSGS